MEEESDFRKWDELIPDTLGLIFKNLSLHELLTVVPRVCKSWERAVMGPYCWQEIDIEEWSKNVKPEIVDRMLETLITRSCGSLRKLVVSGLASEQSILFIANNVQSLRTLRLPFSEIKDSIMQNAAEKLSAVTTLDLSYCLNMGSQALESIGTHCKSLTTLRRVMHPLAVINKLSQNDEALAIASTMPKLKHLEIAYLLVDTPSVVEIVGNCKQLELLDVRGCWNVTLEEEFLEKNPKLKVVGPLVMDCYDMNRWDNCSGYSGSSGYLAWDFVAGEMDDDDDLYGDDDVSDDDLSGDGDEIEEVAMWFYNDVNGLDEGYDWPQSP